MEFLTTFLHVPWVVQRSQLLKLEKTMNKSHIKTDLLITAFMLLLMVLSGCNDNLDNPSSKNDSNHTVTGENTHKAPKVDIHAAIVSSNVEALKQHILAKSDINQKDPFGGSSPLMTAALFDKQEMVTLLIDAGALLNVKNNDGSTALHTAAFFGRPAIVKLLLDKGVDTSIKNNTGATAFDSVAGSFDDVKPYYDMIGQSLAPMGLVLDYDDLKTTRPVIAEMLK